MKIEITAVPSAHAEVVTETPVVTESAKRCLEREIRMRESLSNFRTSWFIFIAKFSYVFHFFTCSCSKMQRGGCSLTSTLKLISKLLKDFSTHISRVATHGSCVLMTPAIECQSMVAIDTSIDPQLTCWSPLGRHVDRYMIDTRPTTGNSRSSIDRIICQAIVCC